MNNVYVHVPTRLTMDEGRQVKWLILWFVTPRFVFELSRTWLTDGTHLDKGHILSDYDRSNCDFTDERKFVPIHPMYEDMAKEMANGYCERMKEAADALTLAAKS